MKTFFIFLFSFLAFLACSKSHVESSPVAPPVPPYVGHWVWYYAYGELRTYTPQSTGKHWEVTFNADSTFSQNGDFSFMQGPNGSGTCSFRLDTAFGYVRSYRLTMRSGLLSWQYEANLIHDTLSLNYGYPNMPYSSFFVKQ